MPDDEHSLIDQAESRLDKLFDVFMLYQREHRKMSRVQQIRRTQQLRYTLPLSSDRWLVAGIAGFYWFHDSDW